MRTATWLGRIRKDFIEKRNRHSRQERGRLGEKGVLKTWDHPEAPIPYCEFHPCALLVLTQESHVFIGTKSPQYSYTY
jgi:hypothetical protein